MDEHEQPLLPLNAVARVVARVTANIADAIKASGLTTPQLVEAIRHDDETSVAARSRLRRGQAWPRPGTCADLARALDVDLSAFYAPRE